MVTRKKNNQTKGKVYTKKLRQEGVSKNYGKNRKSGKTQKGGRNMRKKKSLSKKKQKIEQVGGMFPPGGGGFAAAGAAAAGAAAAAPSGFQAVPAAGGTQIQEEINRGGGKFLGYSKMKQATVDLMCPCAVHKTHIIEEEIDFHEQGGMPQRSLTTLDSGGRGAICGDKPTGKYNVFFEQGNAGIKHQSIDPVSDRTQEEISKLFIESETALFSGIIPNDEYFASLNEQMIMCMGILKSKMDVQKKILPGEKGLMCCYCDRDRAGTIEHTRGQVAVMAYVGDLWGNFMGIGMCQNCQGGRVHSFCDSVLMVPNSTVGLGTTLHILQHPAPHNHNFVYQPLDYSKDCHKTILLRCTLRNLEALLCRRSKTNYGGTFSPFFNFTENINFLKKVHTYRFIQNQLDETKVVVISLKGYEGSTPQEVLGERLNECLQNEDVLKDMQELLKFLGAEAGNKRMQILIGTIELQIDKKKKFDLLNKKYEIYRNKLSKAKTQIARLQKDQRDKNIVQARALSAADGRYADLEKDLTQLSALCTEKQGIIDELVRQLTQQETHDKEIFEHEASQIDKTTIDKLAYMELLTIVDGKIDSTEWNEQDQIEINKLAVALQVELQKDVMIVQQDITQALSSHPDEDVIIAEQKQKLAQIAGVDAGAEVPSVEDLIATIDIPNIFLQVDTEVSSLQQKYDNLRAQLLVAQDEKLQAEQRERQLQEQSAARERQLQEESAAREQQLQEQAAEARIREQQEREKVESCLNLIETTLNTLPEEEKSRHITNMISLFPDLRTELKKKFTKAGIGRKGGKASKAGKADK